jgi:hypothetical protein
MANSIKYKDYWETGCDEFLDTDNKYYGREGLRYYFIGEVLMGIVSDNEHPTEQHPQEWFSIIKPTREGSLHSTLNDAIREVERLSKQYYMRINNIPQKEDYIFDYD